MNYQLLILGSLIAMMYSYVFLPKHEGEAAGSNILTLYPFMYEGKIIIPLSNDKVLHVHHWLIYLILVFFIQNYIFLGFAFTMIIQGLTYRDCLNFIEERPYGY